MTCQFCQTWNTDDDHRCQRCGRRIRSSPGRISPGTYATALAREMEFEARPPDRARPPEPKRREPDLREPNRREPVSSPQPLLFDTPINEPRIISFDSITTPLEREAIHARAASLSRPAAPPRRPRSNESQQAFDFAAQQEVAIPPPSSIVCDCAVAPAGMRVTAAIVDGSFMLGGILLAIIPIWLAPIWFGTDLFPFDKRTLPLLASVALAVCAVYRLLWIAAGRDSAGMRAARLRLVDFYGRTPGRRLRYLRLFGSLISVLAAGLGVIWSLFDEDGLTWHDHISGAFPTPVDPMNV